MFARGLEKVCCDLRRQGKGKRTEPVTAPTKGSWVSSPSHGRSAAVPAWEPALLGQARPVRGLSHAPHRGSR